MTLGRQLRRPDLPTAGARWCEAALPEGSVYRFLARERARLFPAELFADLFQATGRRSVPPSILAVVMVLQRLEGLSIGRRPTGSPSTCAGAMRPGWPMRWRARRRPRFAHGAGGPAGPAAPLGGSGSDLPGDLRAGPPGRAGRGARVLDSAPLEDAVTTQDTVTMLRGAIRGLLRACPPELKTKVRAGLQRDDDYTAPGKPACDWTDRAAREQLVDALVRDAYRAHYALRGERLDPRMAEAAALLATVTGQDIEETSDGRFRIFEGTAPDRVISTVDPQARHGHKTAAHGFDGYKAHVAVDPDSEVICAAEVSPAATGDAVVAPTLLGDLVPGQGEQAARAVVYGDSAYGTGAHLAWLDQQGSRRWSRPSSRPRPAGGSPKTSSASTSRPRR